MQYKTAIEHLHWRLDIVLQQGSSFLRNREKNLRVHHKRGLMNQIPDITNATLNFH